MGHGASSEKSQQAAGGGDGIISLQSPASVDDCCNTTVCPNLTPPSSSSSSSVEKEEEDGDGVMKNKKNELFPTHGEGQEISCGPFWKDPDVYLRTMVPSMLSSSSRNVRMPVSPQVEYLRMKLIRKLGIVPDLQPPLRTTEGLPLSSSSSPPPRRSTTLFPTIHSDHYYYSSSSSSDPLQSNHHPRCYNHTTKRRSRVVPSHQRPRTMDLEPTSSPASSSSEFRMNIFDLSTNDDFRINYLRKLSYANVWVPNARKPPLHQTAIVLDWDDTLLSTSYINFRGEKGLTPLALKQLEGVAQNVIALIELAKKMGHVFIITNAVEGWVEYSAERFLPAAYPHIMTVTIISARNLYEGFYPGEVYQWKIHAFLEIRRHLDSEVIANLISIGDSIIEMDAIHIVGRGFSKAVIKTIKFREKPTPSELRKELKLVVQKFENVCLNAHDLKISLEKKSSRPSPERIPTGGVAYSTSSSAAGGLPMQSYPASRLHRHGRRERTEGSSSAGKTGSNAGNPGSNADRQDRFKCREPR